MVTFLSGQMKDR